MSSCHLVSTETTTKLVSIRLRSTLKIQRDFKSAHEINIKDFNIKDLREERSHCIRKVSSHSDVIGTIGKGKMLSKQSLSLCFVGLLLLVQSQLSQSQESLSVIKFVE